MTGWVGKPTEPQPRIPAPASEPVEARRGFIARLVDALRPRRAPAPAEPAPPTLDEWLALQKQPNPNPQHHGTIGTPAPDVDAWLQQLQFTRPETQRDRDQRTAENEHSPFGNTATRTPRTPNPAAIAALIPRN